MQAQILDATPTKQPDGSVSWKLCHHQGSQKSCGDQPGNYPKIEVKADTPFKISITNDSTQMGIKFASDPVWAQWATTKPAGGWTSKPTGKFDEFVGISGAGTQVLQFRDTNTTAGDIKYQLNFVDKSGVKVNALDPDIRNGGGNAPPAPPSAPGWGLIDSNASLLVALAITFAVGFVLAGMLFKWGQRRG